MPESDLAIDEENLKPLHGSAAAAVAHRLGLVDSQVAVYMPGGIIDVTIAPDWSITIAGGVTRVCQATIWDEMFDVS